MPRATLLERVERFGLMAVLRPDGYLARALDGQTVQRVGPLEVRDGTLKAGLFELGRFYGANGGVFFEVNERLEIQDEKAPLAEIYDDADIINRTLDGAQDAMAEFALSIGRFIVHPIQSLADVARLPQGLAVLLLNSPAYFDRFRFMTRGEQLQALAHLTTSLLLCAGGVGGSTTRISSGLRGLESLAVPAVSLAADGTLVLSRVAVPAGSLATVLDGGPIAVYVLHMANQAGGNGKGWTPPTGGPGKWIEKNESMSEAARQFQSRVTRAPPGWVYRIENVVMEDGTIKDKVDFDGFTGTELQEVKGPGYRKFIKDGEFWIEGAEEMVKQAKTQLAAARGLPVRWYVAEPQAADAIRRLFNRNRLGAIDVICVPPLP